MIGITAGKVCQATAEEPFHTRLRTNHLDNRESCPHQPQSTRTGEQYPKGFGIFPGGGGTPTLSNRADADVSSGADRQI